MNPDARAGGLEAPILPALARAYPRPTGEGAADARGVRRQRHLPDRWGDRTNGTGQDPVRSPSGSAVGPTPLAPTQASWSSGGALVAYLIEADRVLVQQWLSAELLTRIR
ncbi:hypothetical protein GCM10009858_41910 [Terrabacter carboxydivorans]|uniref:Uncharacterized protein n=1 Tax=Terrabacter carboxydivorans TaxID=619730 RepID=A0ABP5ZI43_9MICO